LRIVILTVFQASAWPTHLFLFGVGCEKSKEHPAPQKRERPRITRVGVSRRTDAPRGRFGSVVDL
jgi:hypothetical protein